MTLRDFLDASYALMAEEHQRINPFVDLLSVAEKLQPASASREEAKTPREVKRQNEASMSALQAMLSNVEGAPTPRRKRPRKR